MIQSSAVPVAICKTLEIHLAIDISTDVFYFQNQCLVYSTVLVHDMFCPQ